MLNLIQHCSRAPGLIWIDRDPEPLTGTTPKTVEDTRRRKAPGYQAGGLSFFCRTWVSVVLDAALRTELMVAHRLYSGKTD